MHTNPSADMFCCFCPKINALESVLKALKEEIYDINDNLCDNISYEKYCFYKDKMYVLSQELKNGGFKYHQWKIVE